jgi:hypothetical protein
LVTKQDRFVWLSDVHFGKQGFPLQSNEAQNDLCTALEDALKQEAPLAGLLISGGLTWKADQSEYRQFSTFVRDLLSRTSLNDSYFVTICPGNHDLTLSEEPVAAGAPPGLVSNEARQCCEEMYRSIFYLAPNEYLSSGRRYVVKEGIPVELVAINSSYLQQYKKKFKGPWLCR